MIAASEGYVVPPLIWDITTGEEYDFEILTSPVAIPMGHEIQGYARGYNNSDYPITYTLTGEFIDPDGMPRWTEERTATLQPAPSEGIGAYVDGALDKPGIWVFHIVLKIETTVVDQGTWDTVDAGEVPPPPPPPPPGEFPWMWIAIGGLFIAGGILLIPKAKKVVKKK